MQYGGARFGSKKSWVLGQNSFIFFFTYIYIDILCKKNIWVLILMQKNIWVLILMPLAHMPKPALGGARSIWHVLERWGCSVSSLVTVWSMDCPKRVTTGWSCLCRWRSYNYVVHNLCKDGWAGSYALQNFSCCVTIKDWNYVVS